MADVEIIKASDNPIIRRRTYEGEGVRLDRLRVAAYVRVSTDDEEQLASFESQREYYKEKIGDNPKWVMVGIYADEAITGTRTEKSGGRAGAEREVIQWQEISRHAQPAGMSRRWIKRSRARSV